MMTVVQHEATLRKNAGLGQAHPQKQLEDKVLTKLLMKYYESKTYQTLSNIPGIVACEDIMRWPEYARTC